MPAFITPTSEPDDDDNMSDFIDDDMPTVRQRTPKECKQLKCVAGYFAQEVEVEGSASSDEEEEEVEGEKTPGKRRRRRRRRRRERSQDGPRTVRASTYHLNKSELDALRVLDLHDDYFWFKRRIKHFEKLHKDLTEWCTVLPVVGFNSGKYDLNVLRRHLLVAMQLNQDEHKKPLTVIKNGNTYKLIQSEVSLLDSYRVSLV